MAYSPIGILTGPAIGQCRARRSMFRRSKLRSQPSGYEQPTKREPRTPSDRVDYPVSERRLFSIQVWSGGPGNSYSEDASHKPRALDISHTRVALLMVRDSFGEQGTLNTRVEPNYRQDLYVCMRDELSNETATTDGLVTGTRQLKLNHTSRPYIAQPSSGMYRED